MKPTKLLVLLFTLFATALKAQTYKNGEKLMAFEDDDNLWYEAMILEAGATNSKIHWEGFSAEYDEIVTNKRLWKRFSFFSGR